MTPSTGSCSHRVVLWSLLLGLGLLLSLGAAWFLLRRTPPAVPQLSLERLSPVVVKAISRCRDDVERDPRSGPAWGRLGMMLMIHSLRPEAIRCLSQAADLDPREPRWPYLLGMQLALEEPDRALPPLRRSVELAARSDPTNSTPRLRLAELLLQLDRPDEADQEYRTVQSVEPDNPRALYGLALVALARNDLPAAEEHLKKVAENPHTRQKACAHLAALLERRGSAEASAYLRQANRPPPDLPWQDPYMDEIVRLDQAPEALYRQARKREAEEGELGYRDLTEVLPGARSQLALGGSRRRTGDLEGAEAAYRKALEYPEMRVATEFALGEFLAEDAERLNDRPDQRDRARERAEDAVEHFRQALLLKADHAQAQLLLGRMFRLLGRRKDAINAFRAALDGHPELMEGHLLLGETLAEEGQREAARRSLEEAVRQSAQGDDRARKALAGLGAPLEK
jgi:tetratricopeptide (TPR) repeat protein